MMAHAGKTSALSYVKHFFIAKTPIRYNVIEASWMPSGWKIHVEGITTDHQVNLLRGQKIYAERTELLPTNENEYYVAQLVGMTVQRTDTKEVVGHFRGIEASDQAIQWWRIEGPSREWLIPPKKRFIDRVDLKAGVIWVNHWDDIP